MTDELSRAREEIKAVAVARITGGEDDPVVQELFDSLTGNEFDMFALGLTMGKNEAVPIVRLLVHALAQRRREEETT